MRDEDKSEFRPKKGSVGKVKRIPSLGREVRMADTRTPRRRKDRENRMVWGDTGSGERWEQEHTGP